MGVSLQNIFPLVMVLSVVNVDFFTLQGDGFDDMCIQTMSINVWKSTFNRSSATFLVVSGK